MGINIFFSLEAIQEEIEMNFELKIRNSRGTKALRRASQQCRDPNINFLLLPQLYLTLTEEEAKNGIYF